MDNAMIVFALGIIIGFIVAIVMIFALVWALKMARIEEINNDWPEDTEEDF